VLDAAFPSATGAENWPFSLRFREGVMKPQINYLKHAEQARRAAEQLTCNPTRRDRWIEIERMYRVMAERRATRAAPAVPPPHATNSRAAGAR
jgi:hypothetical protein